MIRTTHALARVILLLASIILATGSVIHAMAFTAAQAAADQSAMLPFFKAALKGLWLSDSGSSLALAPIFVWIATHPRAATRGLVVALGLLPLASAAAIYATMGGFFAGHLMLVIGTMTMAAGLLWSGSNESGARKGLSDSDIAIQRRACVSNLPGNRADGSVA